MILVCAATGLEARACRRGLGEACADGRFDVLQTGIGARAAQASLRDRLRQRGRPAAIVSTGFAGAAGPGLELGHWVIAAEVTREGAADKVAPPEWIHALARRLEGVPVRCLEVDAVWIGEGAQAPEGLPRIVDMESFALATVAQEVGLPFVSCRVVSDTPSHPLPEVFRHLTAAATATRSLDRVKQAMRGAAGALSAPRPLVRYLAASRRLPDALTEGWRVIASRNRPGHMLPPPWNDDPEAM